MSEVLNISVIYSSSAGLILNKKTCVTYTPCTKSNILKETFIIESIKYARDIDRNVKKNNFSVVCNKYSMTSLSILYIYLFIFLYQQRLKT